MLDLLSLTLYEDGYLGARWVETLLDIPLEFNSIHYPDGRIAATAAGFKARDLSPEELAQAEPLTAVPEESEEPVEHPAYELARKGAAHRPVLKSRFDKAARLVEAGGVRRISERSGLVSGSNGEVYEVNVAASCQCRWAIDFTDGTPCSHIIALRMARALNQELEPLSADELAAIDREINRQITDRKKARLAARGENIYQEERRKAQTDGDGARQYARMVYANGRKTIPAEVYDRATGAR